MKITLPLTPETEIAPENLTVEGLAKAFAENEVVREAVKAAIKDQYFEAFPVWEMENRTARKLGQIFLKEGADRLNDVIVTDYVSELDTHELRNAIRSVLENAYQAVCDAVSETDIEVDLHDAVYDAMSDDIETWLSEHDRSKPFDIIPNRVEVEVAFALDYGSLGIDDLRTHHYDSISSIDTILPNANFLRFLKMINMAPSEYIAICAAEGRDPSVASYPENASDYRKKQIDAAVLQWQAVLDVERGTSSAISKLPLQGEYEIAEWNSRVDLIRTIKDYDRPAALSSRDVVNIVDNATYGGVATFVARVPLKDLVAGKFAAPFLAEGGFVGLHHFGKGSGHIETPQAPILIDPVAGRLFIQSAREDAIDDAYGIVSSYYRITTKPYEAPEWQRVGEAKWLRLGEDAAVEITVRTGGDGNAEYWVQSFDGDGNPAGSRETPEVFMSFDAAKSEGAALLSSGMDSPAP